MWGQFSFRGGIAYGCGTADSGMQQSAVPPGHAGEHGNGISGAVDVFPEKEKWPEDGMACLQKLGFKTAAMALRDDSVSIDDAGLMAEEKLAVVLGTEGDGLGGDTIADCDYAVKIPMAHGVDSLNVAAASAVAFWQLGNRT